MFLNNINFGTKERNSEFSWSKYRKIPLFNYSCFQYIVLLSRIIQLKGQYYTMCIIYDSSARVHVICGHKCSYVYSIKLSIMNVIVRECFACSCYVHTSKVY